MVKQSNLMNCLFNLQHVMTIHTVKGV